jgi:hypothetical protein
MNSLMTDKYNILDFISASRVGLRKYKGFESRMG